MRHRNTSWVVAIGAVGLAGAAHAAPGQSDEGGLLAGILERSYQGETARRIIGRSVPVRPRQPAPPAPATEAKDPTAPERPSLPAGVDVAKLSHTERYQDLISRYSKKHGLDEELVKALIYVESGGNPRAVSRKGAAGLMQLMPLTATKLGVSDRFDPAQNIESGTRYLRAMLDRFRSLELALWAYNAGPEAVARGILPRETREYVPQVLRFRHLLKDQSGRRTPGG
jgi:soluble lytic murein transglycosylase-like protein